ncbi:response regulator transcription factor, partial [Chloroflexota bacterium]
LISIDRILGNLQRARQHMTQALIMGLEVGFSQGGLVLFEEIAKYLIEQENTQKAVVLLAFIQNYKSTLPQVKEDIQQLLQNLESGMPPRTFVAAVEQGKSRAYTAVIEDLLHEFRHEPVAEVLPTAMSSGSPYPELLSERELEVLTLIAKGLSNREIADRLYLALSTVKKHINNIYSKLDVKNRTQAVETLKLKWSIS